MKIGYARVSTADQKLSLQEDALREAGCTEVFTDIVSGLKQERPGFDRMMTYVRPGDHIVVYKLDRLGRSMKHLIDTIKTLQSRDIGFSSIHETIDTTTSTGKLIFHIFSAMAEFETDLIRERTHAGLRAARARGKQGGRRFLLKDEEVKRLIEFLDDKKMTNKEISKLFNISPASIYVYKNRYEERQNRMKDEHRKL
jgi:DNA invertase Pin-like site-specific DNA recombinase